jgi:3-oxoacyl-(acyl-carrier-protein) synthase
MIQYGDADVMIAGGAEMATSKTAYTYLILFRISRYVLL